MKKNKKITVLMLGALLTVIGCSSGGNAGASLTDKEIPVTTASDKTVENSGTAENVSEITKDDGETEESETSNLSKTYTCGKTTVSVEFTGEDTISLTDGTGTHQLKRAVSASGELYKDSKGLSIHMKGDEAVYKASAKAKDVICKVAE